MHLGMIFRHSVPPILYSCSLDCSQVPASLQVSQLQRSTSILFIGYFDGSLPNQDLLACTLISVKGPFPYNMPQNPHPEFSAGALDLKAAAKSSPRSAIVPMPFPSEFCSIPINKVPAGLPSAVGALRSSPSFSTMVPDGPLPFMRTVPASELTAASDSRPALLGAATVPPRSLTCCSDLKLISALMSGLSCHEL